GRVRRRGWPKWLRWRGRRKRLRGRGWPKRLRRRGRRGWRGCRRGGRKPRRGRAGGDEVARFLLQWLRSRRPGERGPLAPPLPRAPRHAAEGSREEVGE